MTQTLVVKGPAVFRGKEKYTEKLISVCRPYMYHCQDCNEPEHVCAPASVTIRWEVYFEYGAPGNYYTEFLWFGRFEDISRDVLHDVQQRARARLSLSGKLFMDEEEKI